MSKVLFLDVDGVLNSSRDEHETLNNASMQYLRSVIDQTNCKIVVSSNWRFDPKLMALLFSTEYLKPSDAYPGNFRTSQLNHRGLEIQQWLLNHPDVTDWCIVDDTLDFLPYQRQKLVLTNRSYGLGQYHTFQIIDILGEV